MGYNVIDLIDKAIKITYKKKSIYENICKGKCEIPSAEIMSKVLIKELDKTIRYYEILKEEISNRELEEIDFGIYDKMAFLINEFQKKISMPKAGEAREYLLFYLNLEKDVYSLLIDIQGRFVKSSKDLQTQTYKILSQIIQHKANHIETIERILK